MIAETRFETETNPYKNYKTREKDYSLRVVGLTRDKPDATPKKYFSKYK